MRHILLILLYCLFASPAGATDAEVKKDDGFRLVWVGGINLNLDRSMQRIKAGGFNAIAVSGGNTNTVIAYAQRHQLAVYYWCHLIAGESTQQYVQQLNPEEQKRLTELTRDSAPDKHGYQFGYEPQPGHNEVLNVPLLCFHRPETVEFCKTQLSAVIERFPELNGIAFDYIGYQNYYGCHCEASVRQFEQYRKGKENEDTEKLFKQFSLETLINFYNQMADFARGIKPGIKIAAAIYPVFIPEPLYGNRLNIDYCCQTVTGAYPPFWSNDKTAEYTRNIIQQEKRYFPRPRAVPALAVYQNIPELLKDNRQFSQELQIIKQNNENRRDLSVCPYRTFAASPEPGKIILREFGLE